MEEATPVPTPSPSGLAVWKTNHPILFFGLVFLVLFVFLAIILLLASSLTPSKEQAVTTTPSPTSGLTTGTFEKDFEKVRPAPSVFFTEYDDQSAPLSIASVITTYKIKNSFSKDSVFSFAQKLGLGTLSQTSQDTLLVQNMTDKDKRGLLSFNTATGAFYYQSFGAVRPLRYAAGQSGATVARLFLEELGVFDGTVVCTNSYKRKDAPAEVLFIECHRDWSLLGVPLVTVAGVINMPETQLLKNSVVGQVDATFPKDEAVHDVVKLIPKVQPDTNANGKVRPDEFNTVTAGVYEDGRIYSINSTIRWIETSEALDTKKIMQKDEALELFKQQKSVFSLTLPAGGGSIDWDSVYPKNKASSQKAVITEFSLVFLENLPTNSQSEYTPFYLIRGTALLDSGYTVRFAQALPALKNQVSFQKDKRVAGVSTYLAQNKNIQIGSFTPPPSQAPTRPPTQKLLPTAYVRISPSIVVQPTIPQSPPTQYSSPAGNDITLRVPGYGELILTASDSTSVPHTMFVKRADFGNNNLGEIKKAFYKGVEDQYVITVAKWIVQNSKTKSISSASDLQAIYNRMNGLSAGQQCILGKSDYGGSAPMPQCTPGYAGLSYSKAQAIASAVTKRLLDAAAQSQIGNLAARSDLFPQEIIKEFYWTLVENTTIDYKEWRYISGVSPGIFVYAPVGTQITVKTTAPVTYADPSLANNRWDVEASSENLLTVKTLDSFVKRPYLYYEYDPKKVLFPEPKEGFVVAKDDILQFIHKISGQLALNANERESLGQETTKAFKDIPKSGYYKFSFIDQSDIAEKLPLIFSPKPEKIYRIHLMVTPLKASVSLQEPVVSPITRSKFAVVELSVVAQK